MSEAQFIRLTFLLRGVIYSIAMSAMVLGMVLRAPSFYGSIGIVAPIMAWFVIDKSFEIGGTEP